MSERRDLTVVALIVGSPAAPELWTLRALAGTGCRLRVISAQRPSGVPKTKRLRRLVGEHGVLGVASRMIGGRVIGRREGPREQQVLDRLFDGDDLRGWWAAAGVEVAEVPFLNSPEAQDAIATMGADVVVRVSGGILTPATFSVARLATLNIHHGRAPAIRGMWSIPWGIVEDRPDWIGATVHVVDAGIDTGDVYWRGGAQLAPGDTGDTLFFRTHLEAVAALVRAVEAFAAGTTPEVVGAPAGESTYRSAPGIVAWWGYLIRGRGRRADATLRRALEP